VYTRKDSLPDLPCFGKGLNALGKGFASATHGIRHKATKYSAKSSLLSVFYLLRELSVKKKVTETAN